MDFFCKNYFQKRLEYRIESFEKETLLGLYNIIGKMHKHCIKDYKDVIDDYLTEDLDEIKSDAEFEKIYSQEFHSMFEHISEEFQCKLKDLKCELMKRLDIKKSQFIKEENKSESESGNESESELHNEPNSKNRIFKCQDGNFRYLGPSLKYLQHGCILEPFSKWINKSDCKLTTKPDPEINQKLNSDQMT